MGTVTFMIQRTMENWKIQTQRKINQYVLKIVCVRLGYCFVCVHYFGKVKSMTSVDRRKLSLGLIPEN